MNLDPIKPYADLLKVIAIAVASMVVVAVLFMGGRAVGKGQSAREIASLGKTINKKNAALLAASESLRAGSRALNMVNAEAKRRIAEAAMAEEQAALAGMVAAGAKAAADKRQAKFDSEIDRARRNPSCATLLSANLRSVCGL